MIRKIILIFTIILFFINNAEAKIDVVYPTSINSNVNTSSIFFIGNTNSGCDFQINSQKIKLWNNNFFVHVIPLEYGENKIKLTCNQNSNQEEKIYTVSRIKNTIQNTGKETTPFIEDNKLLYTKTIKENATVREKPSTQGKRVVDLPAGVILYLKGKQNEYYRLAENSDKELWIHSSNINEPTKVENKINTKLEKIKYHSDKNYNYTKFYLSKSAPFELRETGHNIELIIYGIIGNDTGNYKYNIPMNKKMLGYDCLYEGNTLTLRTAKLPDKIKEEKPLRGLTIFLDAGHGGSEKGAVGPTRVNEKDINLEITKYLVKELKNAGSNVILSRYDDIKVPLYDRVEMAKSCNALISISIHNNSLPNGKDPYEKHGTEVHYYNQNSKLLAEIINQNLAADLNLKNGGVIKSSFALNRSTNPISILVEVAYMINPEEYIMLQNANFQQKAALSIKNSIEKYIISIKD